jgi:hypothetical protein
MYSIKQSGKMEDLKKRGFLIPENYFEHFADQIAKHPPKKRLLLPSLAAAAALILLIVAGTIYFETVSNERSTPYVGIEDEIIYDESIDFEDCAIAFSDMDNIDYEIFTDIDEDLLDEYLLESYELEELEEL